MTTTKDSNLIDIGSNSDALILRDAWPDGPDPADAALWSLLNEQARAVVTARLKALIAVERGARPAAVYAKAAGMDPTRFSRLRKRWLEERSLRTVIPQAHRRVRRITPRYDFAWATGDDKLVEREVHQASCNASVSSIARRVVEGVHGTMSLQTATRLVRQQIAQDRLDPDSLREKFGDELRIDLSAVSLALSGQRDDEAPAVVVAMVLEVASGLILGSAAGEAAVSIKLQHEAIANAIKFLNIDERQAINSRMTIVLGWAEDRRLWDLAYALHGLPGVERIIEKTPGRFGKGIVEILGHRIDRLRLRPKSTDPRSPKHRETKTLSMPPMSAMHARALVEEAVANHNAPIIALLNREGLLGPASAAGGRMTNALQSIVSSFERREFSQT